MKHAKNNNGTTLVEVLAVMIISTFVIILTFSMISSAVNSQKKITLDTQLRDEADYYILSLANYLYQLKESHVCGTIQQPADTSSTYILTSEECDNTNIPQLSTGFIDQADGSLALFIEGQKISGLNSNISIYNSSEPDSEFVTKIEKIKKRDENDDVIFINNGYKITITLIHGNQKKTFVNEIRSINN